MEIIINTCINQIKEEFPDTIGIWLFGSMAFETASATSDIDLAVLLPKKINNIRLWQCSQSLASKVNLEIDLIDLLEASTVMRSQIMREGKRIFCTDEFKCNLFETEALTDYLRFNEERQELLTDIKTRGKVFGNNG